MSLNFKFDKSKESESLPKNNPEDIDKKNIEFYDMPGNVRNICFIQPNGEQIFLSYSYLIAAQFFPSEETIVLSFTTHLITFKGFNLLMLYDALSKYQVKNIFILDKRYAETKTENDIFITELHIVSIK